MKRKYRPSKYQQEFFRFQGFTLIEIMITVVIIGLAIGVSAPAFNGTTRKVRTQGVIDEVSASLLKAQREATLRGVPVVVQPLPGSREVFIYANVDRDPALVYSPDLSATNRTVDYEIARVRFSSLAKVDFGSPGTNPGAAKTAVFVDGLTKLPSGDFVFVFEPDGSVRDVGAFRLGDEYGNFFEVRAQPAATGRISVLKYHFAPPWGDDAAFFPRGTDPSGDYPMWKWATQKI